MPLFSGKLRRLTTARPDEETAENLIKCDVCPTEGLHVWRRCADCSHASEGLYFDICLSCFTSSGSSCPKDRAHRTEEVSSDVCEIVIETPDEDLEFYIRSFIESRRPLVLSKNDLSSIHRSSRRLSWECSQNKKLLDTIVNTIVDCSKGRFLLAKLYMNSLNCQQSLRDINDAIKKMQEHRYSISESIDALWEQDMEERVKGQAKRDTEFAIQVLSIISCARRHLSLEELQHALATRTGDPEFDPTGIPLREDILRVTKGLITIGTDSEKIVRLDHQSLADYLHRTRNKWFPNGEVYMAQICLSYLTFGAFSSPCEVEELAAKEVSHAFLPYAVQYWGDHVCEAGPKAQHAAISFLKDPSRVAAYIQLAWAADTKSFTKWDVRRDVSPLHICAVRKYGAVKSGPARC